MAKLSKPLLGIFFLALVLRLGFLAHVGVPDSLEKDALEYQTFAISLVERGEYVGRYGDLATRMPGYPFFVAAVYSVFGQSTAAVLIVQCVLGALACVFLFILALDLFDEPEWALACGLAAAVYYDLILICVQPLSEGVYSVLLSAGLMALYRRPWSPVKRAVSAGLLLGAAFTFRAEVLLPVGLIMMGLPLWFKTFGRKEVVLGLTALSLFFCVWTGRNLIVTQRFLPVGSLGSLSGYHALLLPVSRSVDIGTPLLLAPDVPEFERSALYDAEIKKLKGRLSLFQILKARVFSILSVFYPFLPEFDAPYVFIIPLCAAGLWAARLRPELWPLAGSAILLGAIYMFFGGPASRYRFGFSPFLIILAGAGGSWLRSMLGESFFYRAAGIWGGINALVWWWGPQIRKLVLALKSLAWQ